MSIMKDWIGYAESVEEALKRGLKKLGLTRDDVQMDVISERTSALFSMMDYRRVKVKLTPKPGVQPAAAAKPQRSDDRRSRDERPGRRPDREKNFRDRPDRDRNPQRKDFSRDQQQGRGQDRRRDQKPFGSRDQRQENQDRRRDNHPPRDQNRPPQNRQQDNRRQPFSQQRDRNRPAPQAQNVPRPQREAYVPPPSGGAELPDIPLDFKRSILADTPEQIPTPSEQSFSAPESSSPDTSSPTPSIPQEQVQPMDPAAIETQLSHWKEILGWEDLAWSVKPAEGRRISINLSTAKAEKLVGTSGETLEAFEYLFNLVLTQSAKDAPSVQFIMEGFENPKNQRLIDLAKRAASEVRRSRTVYRMDPMPSADRKIVHQALANETDVETASEGEGPFRKVVVRPKSGASPAPKLGPWKR